MKSVWISAFIIIITLNCGRTNAVNSLLLLSSLYTDIEAGALSRRAFTSANRRRTWSF